MITKRQFKKLADMIKGIKEDCHTDGSEEIREVEDGIIAICKEDNPRFNTQRFRDACAVGV